MLFYGTDFQLHDLPLPRRIDEDWGLFHEESPKNNYLFSHERLMVQFNHTATFKRESDVPLLTQWLTSIDDLESIEYLVSTEKKSILQRELGLAPVVYVQSGVLHFLLRSFK
jgi:alpha-1,3-fucosyltransferase 10